MDPTPPDPFSPAAQGNDAFFKAVYSEPGHATAFFQRHLPPAIAAAIDWTTLAVLPGSFVQSDLHQSHSDLLFSVQAGSRETLLHLIFEHQTTPDSAMPLRLLGYTLEILNRHHSTHGLPLPPVLSFVLHQGPAPWNVSTAFGDLFELPPEIAADLQPFLPQFRHGLLDLSRYDPASGEDDYRQQAILQLMKLARERQILAYFRWLAKTLAKQLPENLIMRLLAYALNADSDLDPETIYRNLSANPELEKQAMSVAEKLRAEGRMIGSIQTLQELLGKSQSSSESLESLPQEELETLHRELRDESEARFKHR